MTHQTFRLSGLTCESCTKLTAKYISKIDGVASVSVNLDTQDATVDASHLITVQEVAAALSGTHYTVAG